MLACGTLGLDLARAWGWAVVSPSGEYVASGHRSLGNAPGRGGQAHQLAMAIADLVTEFGPQFIAVEKPNSQHYGAARNLFGYAMVAEMVAHIRELGYVEIVRGQAYLAVVGKGNAKKLSGVLFGRQFKPLLNSDDESDAILVAMAAHKMRVNAEKPAARVAKRAGALV
jgi:Holliday junction resolvasome RuvABC endonuclease subunit